MRDKEQAHVLLDRLEPHQIDKVVRLLESLTSEAVKVSASERKALAEADQWLQKNTVIPNEDILAEFGLTSEDWERLAREPENQPG